MTQVNELRNEWGYPNSARALTESAVRARAGPGRFWGPECSAEWMRLEQPEVEPYCACESCACCGGVVRAVGARALPGRPCARALPGRNEANRAGTQVNDVRNEWGYPNSARALSESAVRARAGPGRFWGPECSA